MSKLVEYVIDILSQSESPYYLEDLVTNYMLDVKGIIEDSSDFDIEFTKYMRRIKNDISKINQQIKDNGFDHLAIDYITPEKNAIKSGRNFSLIVKANNRNHEEPNRFANRVAYEVLKRFECGVENIHITSDSNDGGIDFWGVVYHKVSSLNISYDLLILGQVKKYKERVTIKEIREFIGAVNTFKIKSERHEFSATIPIVKVFIATSDLTKNAVELAKFYGIIILTKLHLCELGIY